MTSTWSLRRLFTASTSTTNTPKTLAAFDDKIANASLENLAPNLREVHIWRENWPTEASARESAPLPSRYTSPKASLGCLELRASIANYTNNGLRMTPSVISSWNSRTDFSVLHTLKLGDPAGQDVFESLSRDCSFPNLTTLVLTCYSRAETGPILPATPTEDEPPPRDYYEAVKRFVQRLPRLVRLEIAEWDGSVPLAPALPSGLRKLFLRTNCGPKPMTATATVSARYLNISAGHIAQLADACPGIEHLTLQIRRSLGDADEVAIYRALGRFPSLRHLSLTLDLSPPPWTLTGPPETAGGAPTPDTVVEDHFDLFDARYEDGYGLRLKPYRRGHVLDILVNSAVDETLARAIFSAVDSAKARNHRDGVVFVGAAAAVYRLQTLVLRSASGMAFRMPPNNNPSTEETLLDLPPGYPMEPFLNHMGRQWFVRRDLLRRGKKKGDGGGGGLLAVELLRRHRESREKVLMGPGHDVAKGPVWKIFRRVWPHNKKHGRPSHWTSDWRSWPLDTGGIRERGWDGGEC